ncbi:MAG TPA: phosphate-starvation-inducible PsiE family protein [Acidocella sp.]|jgi:uncharacterized membrane protein (DUF373 family)|nr:phosphate-starvation-inducible PsiE family protein [Acidocella sp.]OYV50037.1 MAG: hypothetical protein B7Z77_06660 [Acidocella sp. 20-58-15]HQT39055.1 phosphate-starvation-inducible PsiE family protein [Acidocella sp.]
MLDQEDTENSVQSGIRSLVFRLYDRAVDLIILGVIPLMLIALVFAFAEAIIGTTHMIPLLHSITPDDTVSPDEVALRMLVARVLDVVILIELFNTFMEYARTRHIRLSNLLDVTIVFALRETLIKLYAQNFSSTDLLALCVVVIVLVIARSVATRFSREREPQKQPVKK